MLYTSCVSWNLVLFLGQWDRTRWGHLSWPRKKRNAKLLWLRKSRTEFCVKHGLLGSAGCLHCPTPNNSALRNTTLTSPLKEVRDSVQTFYDAMDKSSKSYSMIHGLCALWTFWTHFHTFSYLATFIIIRHHVHNHLSSFIFIYCINI